MPSFQKIEDGDIEVGVPLKRPVYDKHGTLLIKVGGTIGSAQQLSILLDKEIFFVADEGKTPDATPAAEEEDGETSVFAILDAAKEKLTRIFDLLRQGRTHDDFVTRIKNIASAVQKACALDADAALANLQLELDAPYAVVHHLQAAILCELTGKKLGVKDESRRKLVKAALTRDIDLMDIQHVLDKQTIPLSDKHIERIQKHPASSSARLRELGVSDKTWLDAVDHHHERLDGSGYPDHLSGNAIGIPARLLAITDIYSAMIRDRANRRAILPKEALRKLMLEHKGKIDERLTQVLIKEIGIYPPGVLVQLASKEIAVVKSRGNDGLHPLVYAFIDAAGMPMRSPYACDTTRPEFQVKGMVPTTEFRASIPTLRNIWQNSQP
ncbi:MAG: HD domain-containing phosphohydrolase [Sterolibacterium sp.]|jgi:HD-GYP domain-containing protein (c-di-GMP phosphodiesterase class II)